MQYRGLFIGLTTIDIQYFVDEFPLQNTKVKTNAPDILVGGPAANAAVAFAYLNNGAYLATVVGENSFSSFIKRDLQETRINLVDVVDGQKLNPIVAAVVTSGNGNRNIFTHNPACIHSVISPSELFRKVDPEILLIDGFYPEFSLECAKLAKRKNIQVIVDCGSWKPQYDDLLKYTDIAICSADFIPPNCTGTKEVYDFFNRFGISKVAISRGEKSILFKQDTLESEVNISKAKAIDTLGAGDFLHGAFCYYYLQSNSFKSALQKASKLATFSCGVKGTREWLKY